MAVRGRRPKQTVLRVITGNPGHRPLPESEIDAEGPVERPKFVKGRAARIWAEFAPYAPWLRRADSYKFAAWCGMTAEVERGIDNMSATRIAQWRYLGSELGLDPTGRLRIGTGTNGQNAGKKAKTARYFD